MTLGNPPRLFRWMGVTVLVPWRDIRAVALFHQYARWPARLLYVALKLDPDAPAPEGTSRAGSFLHHSYSGLIPHVRVDISRVSRPVNGWRLSRRLVAAVHAYAPGREPAWPLHCRTSAGPREHPRLPLSVPTCLTRSPVGRSIRGGKGAGDD